MEDTVCRMAMLCIRDRRGPEDGHSRLSAASDADLGSDILRFHC